MLFTLNEIKNITEEKIYSLKENRVAEDKHLEYKLTLPGEKYDDKKEFLADLTSFANADGGTIFYGIKAKDGIPEDIPGLAVDNPDKEILRLENLLRTSIEPRIIGVVFYPFKLSSGRYLIFTYISKSFNPPHVVNFQGHWKFYSRNSAGKYPMDLGEVRSSIILAEHYAERIKNFRIERISKIISNDVNVPLVDSPTIVLHLFPLKSFEKGYKLDLSVYLDNYQNLKPLFDHTSFQRYNLDGILTYSTTADFKTAEAYLLLYYNGILETVNARTLTLYNESRRRFQIEAMEKGIINELKRFLTELNSLDISCPIVITVSYLKIKGFNMDSYNYNYISQHPVDRDHLFFPEVLINDYSEQIELVIKPIFDSLWQAFGFSKCRHYNDKGEWILK